MPMNLEFCKGSKVLENNIHIDTGIEDLSDIYLPPPPPYTFLGVKYFIFWESMLNSCVC